MLPHYLVKHLCETLGLGNKRLTINYIIIIQFSVAKKAYKQERDCLVHFVHLATSLLKDEESVRDNHVLARNFAKD